MCIRDRSSSFSLFLLPLPLALLLPSLPLSPSLPSAPPPRAAPHDQLQLLSGVLQELQLELEHALLPHPAPPIAPPDPLIFSLLFLEAPPAPPPPLPPWVLI
eukprot:8334644-Pyramimonas_sp.AAC.1